MGIVPLVIGLCGRARHGKDDVARILTDRFKAANYSCFPCSVSMVIHEDAIRRELVKSVKREDCTEAEIKALVDLGNWGRDVGEQYWLMKLEERILREKPQIAVVTGLRFASEEEWLRTLKGILVRINRLNQDSSEYISLDRNPNDVTETSQYSLNADYEIVVKTDQFDWLRAQANTLAKHLLDKMQFEGGVDGSGE